MMSIECRVPPKEKRFNHHAGERRMVLVTAGRFAGRQLSGGSHGNIYPHH